MISLLLSIFERGNGFYRVMFQENILFYVPQNLKKYFFDIVMFMNKKKHVYFHLNKLSLPSFIGRIFKLQ